MEHALEIHELAKTYKKFRLDRISLQLPEGYILGLIGPNGAGKTTTLKILMDMVHADSGTVKIFGLDHRRHLKEIKNRVGYLSEEPMFYGDKTVARYGAWFAGFYDAWDVNLFERLLTDFQISRSKKTRHLSKGMKAQAGLIAAVAHRPDLLLLDEPSTGLDAVVRKDILNAIVRTVADDGRTCVFSSHLLDEVEQMSDYVFMIDAGRLILQGTLSDIQAQHQRLVVRLDLAELSAATFQ